MARKKTPEQMNSKDIAIAIMCDHLGIAKTQVAGWDVVEKIAEAIDEAEKRGELRANSNSILNRLMASSKGKKEEAPASKQTKKEEKTKDKKSSSTFGGDLIPTPSEDPVPGSM